MRALRRSIRDRIRGFANWARDVGRTVTGWGRDTLRSISNWADNTSRRIREWITNRIDAFKDFVADAKKTLADGFQAAADAIMDKLNPVIEKVQGWVNKVKDILGEILDFLGISGNENPKKPGSADPDTSRLGSQGQPGGTRRFAGGIYDTSGIRYMASGGLVDVSGVVTSMATGLSRELSRGAIWQEAVGGISDGLKPRVVYGEGRPGSGPKKEGYVPEDMEPSRALPLLSEMASWFNLKVGAGPEEPHAHLPEATARALFEQVPRGVIQMAAGGVYGVPGGRIGFGYQEYVPNYPYSADRRHKGIDIYAPTGTNIIAEYPGRVQDHPSWSTGLASAHDATGKSGGGTYGLVHGHITPATQIGGEVRPGQTIGSLVSHYGGSRLHLQTYTTGYNYRGYSQTEPPLADPAQGYPAVGGPIPPPGSHSGGGFDIWGAIQGLINRIPTPNLGDGPFLNWVEPAMKKWAVDAITSFVRKHLPGPAPGEGDAPKGGGVEAIRKAVGQGLRYGRAFAAAEPNVEKMVILAGKESNYGQDTYNESSGATGPWQMMPETFAAYQVAASDSIRNWTHNAAASSRYQKDRYGGLVTFSPYTAGGMARKPQFASVAERGPEFFMPLDQPETARRFLDFIEDLHSERVIKRHSPHRYEDVAPADTPSFGGGSSAGSRRVERAVERQTERLERKLDDLEVRYKDVEEFASLIMRALDTPGAGEILAKQGAKRKQLDRRT